ncbi:MAG: ABC-2 family transporter protein [Candidatus Nanoarchaeia archaeon]
MEIKEDLSDRSRFLIWIISKPIFMLINVIIWTAIFSNSSNSTIGGFSVEQTINYFLFQSIFASLVFNNLSERMGNRIYSGELSTTLLKPVNIGISLTSKALGGRVFSFFYESLPTLLIGLIFFNFKIYSFPMLLISIFSLFLGLLINCFFSLSWSIMYFKMLNHWPFERIKRFVISFVSGFYIPLNFLPLIFQNVLKYLPFNYFSFEATRIFLNLYSYSQVFQILLIQIFWVILLYLMFNFLFKKVVKKFEGVGS